jgi:hypothetical protein
MQEVPLVLRPADARMGLSALRFGEQKKTNISVPFVTKNGFVRWNQ